MRASLIDEPVVVDAGSVNGYGPAPVRAEPRVPPGEPFTSPQRGNPGAARTGHGRSRRLVVVRAGDASLHERWLSGAASPAFDLGVSYYGTKPGGASDADYYLATRGGKWEGLHEFFAQHPGLLAQYDWIWLPDDDIDTTVTSVNRLFDLMDELQLDLAQPSLSWDSYYNHFTTLNNPRFKLRYTNVVEVMAPVFSSALLQRIVPLFAGRRFGWGLDFLWSRWLPQPSHRSAILDAVQVRHSRPAARGSLYKDNVSASPDAECQALLRQYHQRKPAKVVYGGVTQDGVAMGRGARLLADLYAGWEPLCRGSYVDQRHLPMSRFELVNRVRRVTLRSLDLSPLPAP